MKKVSRRDAITAVAGALLAAPYVRRGYAAQAIRLGLLSDINGPYSSFSGAAAFLAVKVAVDDFSKIHPDIPVEVQAKDFQLKPDVGLSIARDWFTNGTVDCILDVPSSSLALGLGTLARDTNRVVVVTSATSEELTGLQCGPNHIHWTHDTYALGATVVRAALKEKLDTWFFILPDYAAGKSQATIITKILEQNGGKVLGSLAHPFPGTTDFSSYLLQARSSGAKVICLANSGEDTINCIKQAAEFDMLGHDQAFSAPMFDATFVNAIGLEAAQGLRFSTSGYWDQNEGSRNLGRRLAPALKGGPPASNHLGDYSGAYNYLKAVAAVGLARAKVDGRAVIEQLKSAPFEDPIYGHCVVRADGRMVHDMLMAEVKKPNESTGPLDVVRITEVVPGDKAFRSLEDGRCPMVRT